MPVSGQKYGLHCSQLCVRHKNNNNNDNKVIAFSDDRNSK